MGEARVQLGGLAADAAQQLADWIQMHAGCPCCGKADAS
jgi:hypothetical protein